MKNGAFSAASFVCANSARNEAWILPRCLACADTWADQIVVVDDGSTDDSRAIAAAHPKTTVFDFKRTNDDSVNEDARWRARIAAARSVPVAGRRIILALDSDEMLSANFHHDLGRVAQAPSGTVITARWANLLPGLETCVMSIGRCAVGYVDDGCAYEPVGALHVPRVPNGPQLHLEDTVLLHYKFAAPTRARARIGYYQVWETLDQTRSPLKQYRLYHRNTAPEQSRVRRVDPSWFSGYEQAGIDMYAVPDAEPYYSELTVRLLQRHGTKAFRRADIWDIDWNAVAARAGVTPARPIGDPRGGATRLAHRWLQSTQTRQGAVTTRLGERILRMRGW